MLEQSCARTSVTSETQLIKGTLTEPIFRFSFHGIILIVINIILNRTNREVHRKLASFFVLIVARERTTTFVTLLRFVVKKTETKLLKNITYTKQCKLILVAGSSRYFDDHIKAKLIPISALNINPTRNIF